MGHIEGSTIHDINKALSTPDLNYPNSEMLGHASGEATPLGPSLLPSSSRQSGIQKIADEF
ncbi:hypothetical protein HAX54_037265, partial [Datura stramonium]|nr:hypothetical protein [Datura stramonium]